MTETFIIGFVPAGSEWIIVLLVVLLLFGGSKLPQLAKALGQSKRAFREGQDEAEEEAQREKLRQVEGSPASRASLGAIDDVTLFEEARRRAAMQPSTDKK